MRYRWLVPLVVLLAACTPESAVDAPPPTVAPPVEATVPAPVAAPVDWEMVANEATSGVVPLRVEICGTSFSTTGALVAPDLVLTAANMVFGAVGVSVGAGDSWLSGQVVAADEETQVGLVRLESPLDGHVFTIPELDPPIGTQVAVIGYATGEEVVATDELTLTNGTVNATGVLSALHGSTLSDQLLLLAPLSYEDRGSLVVTGSGDLVGVVSRMDQDENGDPNTGQSFALSAAVARSAIDSLTPQSTVPPDPCAGDLYFSIEGTPDSDRARELTDVLWAHGVGINESNYAAAFSLFTTALRERVGPLDRWEDGVETSVWRKAVIHSVGGPDEAPTVDLALTTEESEEVGTTCTVREMTYTFAPYVNLDGDLAWQISGANEHTAVECPTA